MSKAASVNRAGTFDIWDIRRAFPATLNQRTCRAFETGALARISNINGGAGMGGYGWASADYQEARDAGWNWADGQLTSGVAFECQCCGSTVSEEEA